VCSFSFFPLCVVLALYAIINWLFEVCVCVCAGRLPLDMFADASGMYLPGVGGVCHCISEGASSLGLKSSTSLARVHGRHSSTEEGDQQQEGSNMAEAAEEVAAPEPETQRPSGSKQGKKKKLKRLVVESVPIPVPVSVSVSPAFPATNTAQSALSPKKKKKRKKKKTKKQGTAAP
jgi:hypothetical protein